MKFFFETKDYNRKYSNLVFEYYFCKECKTIRLLDAVRYAVGFMERCDVLCHNLRTFKCVRLGAKTYTVGPKGGAILADCADMEYQDAMRINKATRAAL